MSSPTTDFIRQALIQWFKEHGKDYPWRRTTNPWRILVSEVMLQQTTIATVLNRYERWLEQFPTPKDLAEVTEEVALRSWEGLGYYRRVRSLQKIAKIVTENFNGEFPKTFDEIKSLPGIGDYTAGALCSFAYNLATPIVDANVARVIARLDNYREPVDARLGVQYLWQRAKELIDPTEPRIFNSALMELGQTLCNKTPDCLLCPLRDHCQGKMHHPEELPAKLPKIPTTAIEHHDVLYIHNGAILLAKSNQGRHVGMYRFPQREEEYFQLLEPVLTQKYSVTRYKVTRHIYHITVAPQIMEDEEMVPLSQLVHVPFASPDRKALHSPAISNILHHHLS